MIRWAPLAAVAAAGAWIFAPVLGRMVRVWASEPDYGHAFLVPLVAAGMVWARRNRRPAAVGDWRGLAIVVVGLVVWSTGERFYFAALGDAGFLLWLVGACWLLFGPGVLRWAAPALGFLVLMVPMPYRLEQSLTLPLQHTATAWSCWLLQCCGRPALVEGNILLVDDVRLEVAQACSGLRLFTCVAALAYLYAALLPRPRWKKVALAASVAPVAVAANALRLTATALVWKQVAGDHAREMLHETAGWLMVPLAAALLYAVMRYLDCITVPVEVVEPTQLLRHRARHA